MLRYMRLMIVLGIALLCSGRVGFASAQTYPSKPIQWIVPFSAAGTGDVVCRAMAPKLSALLGQPIVVENRPGAGGVIATDFVAKAPRDGYTLVLGGTSAMVINASLMKLPYDPVRDFAPISGIVEIPYLLLASTSLKANSVQELIALAKVRPGQLNYASPGNGTGSHLAMEMLKSEAGIGLVHVPYKGSGPAVTDLMAGNIQLMFEPPATVASQLKAGKLKVLAISSEKRMAGMSDTPTLAEQGVSRFNASGWMGVLAPAGTPENIINRLNSVFVSVLADPEVLDQFRKLALVPMPGRPEEFAALIKSDIPRWGKVIVDARVKVD